MEPGDGVSARSYRGPFRGLAVLACFALLACDFEKETQTDLSIQGYSEILGASVSIDGIKVGELDYMIQDKSWMDRFLRVRYSGEKKWFQDVLRDVVVLNLDLDPMELASGTHVVTIEKDGVVRYRREFAYPIETEDGAAVMFFMERED